MQLLNASANFETKKQKIDHESDCSNDSNASSVSNSKVTIVKIKASEDTIYKLRGAGELLEL